MNRIGIHCFISGRVQGVWFRASTKTEADRLGITGFARNLPDGRVEVVAFGDGERIVELMGWLKVGPPLAKVAEFTHEAIPWEEHATFEVLR